MVLFEDERVIVASSTFSDGPMGSSTNDGPGGRSRRNREAFFLSLGLDPKNIIGLGLIHGARVALPEDVAYAYERIPNIDGAVWKPGGRNVGVYVSHADCMAVAFVGDGVLGLCHAGSEGLVAGIVPGTADLVVDSANVDSVSVYTSPFLQRCHHQVGFNDKGVGRYEKAGYARFLYPVGGAQFVDMGAVIREQCMDKVGLDWGKVHTSMECTYCARRLLVAPQYFSRRRILHGGGNPDGMNNLTVAAFK